MVSLKKILNKILVRINSEADYVVEQGTNDGWEYRKWNSGRLEYFSTSTHNLRPGDATGNVYKGEVIEFLPRPTMFNNTPSHVYVASVGDTDADNIISMNAYPIGSTRLKWYVWTATMANVEVTVSFYLIGTWK